MKVGWHGFTQMDSNAESWPIVVDRTDGRYVIDTEGRRYLDFLSGLAVVSLGHAHPDVADAIAEQARTLLHVSNPYYNEVQPPVAEIPDRSPGGGGADCSATPRPGANGGAARAAITG